MKKFTIRKEYDRPAFEFEVYINDEFKQIYVNAHEYSVYKIRSIMATNYNVDRDKVDLILILR